MIDFFLHRLSYHCHHSNVKHRFVCLMPHEAKQTETSEFGAEEYLLWRWSKKNRWLVLKRPEFPNGFQGRVFKGKIWGRAAGYMTSFQMAGNKVTGWCLWNLKFLVSTSLGSTYCDQVIVTILHPRWGGGVGRDLSFCRIIWRQASYNVIVPL